MRPAVKYLLIAGVLFAVAFAGALSYAATRIEPMAKEYIETALAKKFGSKVELDNVKVSILAGPIVTAHNVKVRYGGRTDVPPLLEFRKLVISTSALELMSPTRKIHQIKFEGLQITVPPKPEDGGRRLEPLPKNPDQPQQQSKPKPDFVIEHIDADGTLLRILPRESWRQPLTWDLKKLKLDSVGPNQPMNFRATLRNAKPPGDIETTGKFGPWANGHPGATPVEGTYKFRNADLGVFKGIAGILSSDGSYKGLLEKIVVDGSTDTPDFRLTTSGNPVPLKTKFHAIVDGTTGDTYLEPVNAQLAGTSITCRGGVTGQKGVKGKTIDLAVEIDKGKIDDVLRLAVRSEPALAGMIRMRAKLLIPPGPQDVVEKMRLDGQFRMDRVQFSSVQLQQKVNELSQRARGQHNSAPENVGSFFHGRFHLGRASIGLEELNFRVPGAHVLIAGAYGMRSEKIDMEGRVRLEARVSQLVKGWKSWLLKPVDPFFAKEGAGAVFPIAIKGTRKEPKFGLNFRGGKKQKQPTRQARAAA